MSKTWIKNNGEWHKVKNIWIKIDGIWGKNIIPKCVVDGSYKDFISYYRKAKYLFAISDGYLITIDISNKKYINSELITDKTLEGLSVNPITKTIYVFGNGIYKYKFDDLGNVTLLSKLTDIYCEKLQVNRNDNIYCVISNKLYKYDSNLVKQCVVYTPENNADFDFALDENSNIYIVNTNNYDNFLKITKDGEGILKKYISLPSKFCLVLNYFPSSKYIYITAGHMTGEGYNITIIDGNGNEIGSPSGEILPAKRKFHNLESYLYLFPHMSGYQKRDLDGNIIFKKYLSIPNYIESSAINNDENFFITSYLGKEGMQLHFFNKDGEKEKSIIIGKSTHAYVETEFGSTNVFYDFYNKILK